MLYFFIGLVLVLVDFFSKRAAILHLKGKSSIEIISGVLRLNYVENTGAAFGILKNMRWLFVLTTLIMIVILYVWFNKSYFKNEFMRFGIVIVIAGAIGNLIDRLIYGYVVDFIDFYLINFPVFNIADCLVCIGAGMLLIHYIFLEKEKKDVKS